MIILKLTKKEMFLIVQALDEKSDNIKNYLDKPNLPEEVREYRKAELIKSEELSLSIWSEIISN